MGRSGNPVLTLVHVYHRECRATERLLMTSKVNVLPIAIDNISQKLILFIHHQVFVKVIFRKTDGKDFQNLNSIIIRDVVIPPPLPTLHTHAHTHFRVYSPVIFVFLQDPRFPLGLGVESDRGVSAIAVPLLHGNNAILGKKLPTVSICYSGFSFMSLN